MKLLILVFFSLFHNWLGNCQYNGYTRRVIPIKNMSQFKYVPINLGEFALSINLINCKTDSSGIYLEGKIAYPKSIEGKMIMEENNVKLLLCKLLNDKKLITLDTLGISDKSGNFKVYIPKAKNKYLVLYKKDRNSTVYKVEDFTNSNVD